MRMPVSIHSIDKAQPKVVAPQTSAPVAAHREAMRAELEAQIAKADLEAQIAELKAQIAELRADRRSVRDSWRNICFAPSDSLRQQHEGRWLRFGRTG
jgi:hypothetical protein